MNDYAWTMARLLRERKTRYLMCGCSVSFY